MNGDKNWLKCPPKDPNRMLRTADIWQKPRRYVNKPNYNLDVSDIEGAQPKPEKSNMGIRKVNPLNPEYSWCTSKVIEPLQTKFLRNTLNIDDIYGAKPSRTGPYSIKQRDSMNFKDIDKSYSGWNKTQYKRKNYSKHDALNVKDINNNYIGINRLRGNRCTNPLQPEYQYNNSKKSGLLSNNNNDNRNINILGFVKGSKPSKLNRFLNKDEFNLRTEDIVGAKSNHSKWKRKYPKDPNFIGDIKNTQPNTTTSFKTKRCTNPLNPKYQFLDYKRPQPQNNNNVTSKSISLRNKNMMNKYEKQQHSEQVKDDIKSVRSLTLNDC